MNGVFLEVSTASLVPRQGCRTWVVAKQFVLGGSGASWVVGTHFGGVLLGLIVCLDVLELLVVVLSQAEQEIRSSSSNTSTVTWQFAWTREALWWAGGA